ncbi:MAG TPA: toll/interleukin-1 receptor domain-containing protein [Candidatus Dormibacteraeota bacterium]|jgi:hypothetical protein|nr:toll/interleukin-1 receptor domain-containing protein [Candidatus Dormibacteraeota bacterium]
MVSKIFISYSFKDDSVAEEITVALDKAGFAPWIAKRMVKPGDSFIEKMNEGLGSASYVLVLLSQVSIKSRWVSREWMSAIASQGTAVIPILLEECEVPKLLSHIVHIDLRKDKRRGIKEIVEFFKNETATSAERMSRGSRPLVNRAGHTPLGGASRRQVRLVASRCMDGVVLKQYCFDSDVDLSNLGGSSVSERLLSLLHDVAREGSLSDFVDWLLQEKKACVEHQIRVLKTQKLWDWKPSKNL